MKNMDLMEYCWVHKLFGTLETTDGEDVEVLDAGLHSRRDGTFFNAKIRINGTLWVGNVIPLEKSSEWYLRGFDKTEPHAVLLLVSQNDSQVMDGGGHLVPTSVVRIPEGVSEGYERLMYDESHTECHRWNAENCSRLAYHAWIAALETEWMESQTHLIASIHESTRSWQQTYFIRLAMHFGFGVKDAIYREWAETIPLSVIEHHRDDLFQIEAIFLGQAGLLELEAVPDVYHREALNEGYFQKIRNEYLYLAHKYQLRPIDWRKWEGKVSPYYTPQRCLSWLACWYYKRAPVISSDISHSYEELANRFDVGVSPYWESHSQFGAMLKKSKRLNYCNPRDMVMYIDIPFLFAYGREIRNEVFCDRAFELMEQAKPLNNPISCQWRRKGFEVKTAGDSVASIQLKREYCDRGQCLRCRFGNNFIREYIRKRADRPTG